MDKKRSFLKKLKCKLSDHADKWELQLSGVEQLAEANDIEFDRRNFKRPHRKFHHFKIYWPQSDAAEYIAEQLYQKRLQDPMFFRPWSAAWLPVDRKEYEEHPYFYVPIKELSGSNFNESERLRAFVFSTKPGQDVWLSPDSKFMIMPICKTCHHKWNHYPAFKVRSGEFTNPNDTVVVEIKDGKFVEQLMCPVCHSTDIYKDGHMLMEETFNLQRFIDAQEIYYPLALAEIKGGKKIRHWIWFIFPQVIGLGFSHNSHFYGLHGADEAREYLKHPILGTRLREITSALLALEESNIETIMPGIDAVKLKSSMTLFDGLSPNDIFNQVLAKYFHGERDELTIEKVGYEF